MNVISLIQETGITVTFVKGYETTLGAESPRIQSLLALGSLNNGKLEIFVSKSNSACVFHGSSLVLRQYKGLKA